LNYTITTIHTYIREYDAYIFAKKKFKIILSIVKFTTDIVLANYIVSRLYLGAGKIPLEFYK